ncbi:MAG: helix-turn-helix domain-containing protein [Oscillospiraceae bacterium]|nr:helix-turn-helix domain-containing protein [Oscillospiraceae bacterium]
MMAANIGDSIRKRRTELHYSQKKVADYLGISQQAYSKYENNQNSFNFETALKLGEILDVSLDDLGLDYRKNTTEPSNVGAIEPSENIKMIPVFGSVSAGFGAYACSDIIEYAPALVFGSGNNFIYINVEGNSMSPKIEEGDRILVRKQDTCDSGDVAVVMLNSDEAVVKKVTFGDGYITLTSFNPKYPPRTFVGAEMEDMSIVGKVVNVTKPL